MNRLAVTLGARRAARVFQLASGLALALVSTACPRGDCGPTCPSASPVIVAQFVAMPGVVIAGQPFGVTVQLVSSGGQRQTTATNAVTLSISGASLSGNTTASAVAGVATFSGLSLTKAGVYQLTATVGASTTNSGSLVVSPGAPFPANSRLSPFSGIPVGVSTQMVFRINDAYGNPTPGLAFSVAPTISGVSFTPGSGTTAGDGSYITSIYASTAGTFVASAVVGGVGMDWNVTTVAGSTPPGSTPVSTISISPSSVSVAAGGTVQLSATLRDASGNLLTGRTVSWATSDSTIARVSSTGLVTGVASGTAGITATSEGKSATAIVLVSGGQVSGQIALNPLTQGIGSVGGCTGGTVVRVITVTAPSNVSWKPVADVLDSQWASASGGGIGSGSFTATISVGAQTPTAGFNCSQTSGFNYTDKFDVTFSFPDGRNTTLAVQISWTYVLVL